MHNLLHCEEHCGLCFREAMFFGLRYNYLKVNVLNLFKPKPAEADGKIFFGTDIHCHVLPGVDDGAQTIEKAIELVDWLAEHGVSRIIASPHVAEDKFPNTQERLDQALGELNDALKASGRDIEVERSAEFRIDDFSLTQIGTGAVRSIPGNYLLVENSFIQEPFNLDNTLFQLKVDGYKLILAHPERYMYYHTNRRRYGELHTNGTYFQINLLSLAGHYGKEVKRMAEWLIEKNLVDFIGTDIHRTEHLQALDRYLTSRDYARHRRLLSPHLLNHTL